MCVDLDERPRRQNNNRKISASTCFVESDLRSDNIDNSKYKGTVIDFSRNDTATEMRKLLIDLEVCPNRY